MSRDSGGRVLRSFVTVPLPLPLPFSVAVSPFPLSSSQKHKSHVAEFVPCAERGKEMTTELSSHSQLMYYDGSGSGCGREGCRRELFSARPKNKHYEYSDVTARVSVNYLLSDASDFEIYNLMRVQTPLTVTPLGRGKSVAVTRLSLKQRCFINKFIAWE